jgi:hypothetical protein
MAAKKTAPTIPAARTRKKRAAAAGGPAEPAVPAQDPANITAPAPPKLSALDAAAKVLSETGRAMTCQELIDAMAAQRYWTSPQGRTPHATLYAAIAREIQTKGAQARFRKTARGQFSLHAQA